MGWNGLPVVHHTSAPCNMRIMHTIKSVYYIYYYIYNINTCLHILINILMNIWQILMSIYKYIIIYYICTLYSNTHHVPEQLLQTFIQVLPPVSRSCSEWKPDGFPQQRHHWSTAAVVFFKAKFRWEFMVSTLYHENWGVSISLSDF